MADLTRELKDTFARWATKGRAVRHEATGVEICVIETPDTFIRDWIRDLPIPADPDFRQEPVEFEKKHGMTGIAHKYEMPGDFSPAELFTYTQLISFHAIPRGDMTMKDGVEKLGALYDATENLNPDLRPLRGHYRWGWDDESHMYFRHAVLTGIASAYSPADILFFLDEAGCGENPQEEFRRHSIKARADGLHWRAAPQTLGEIERQLDAREAESNTSPRRRPGPGLAR